MPLPRGVAPRHYKPHEKIALVAKIGRLQRAGMTLNAAAAAAGTTVASYKSWVAAGVRPLPADAGASRRYDPVERERLVDEIDQMRDAGVSTGVACRAVGISHDSYLRWREELTPPAMRPVEITALVPVGSPAEVSAAATPAPMTTSGLVVVTPAGYRIEGLGVETAARLLRALA
jgi:hypothetical protein